MASCAFLTKEGLAVEQTDDYLMLPYLEKMGIELQFIPWKQTNTWEKADIAIIRSTWDYHLMPDTFAKHLKSGQHSSLCFHNDLSLIRWNMDKHYLLDLEKRGIPIVPTVFLTGKEVSERLDSLFHAWNTDFLVVKPTISASAYMTRLISRQNIERVRDEFPDQHGDSQWMVQPFMKSIQSEGEFSLIYFNGYISHTVLKIPAKIDFRVQEELGGRNQLVGNQVEFTKLGERLIERLPILPLYARIDIVRDNDGNMVVMEAELIEPSLFLKAYPPAIVHFAEAIQYRYTQHTDHLD